MPALPDVLIVLGYFATVLLVGWRMGRGERATQDFVVGGRRIPWWAALGSLVATEISAVTFLAVTGTGATQDLTYLQFGLGSIAGRVVVAMVFLTAFYRGEVLTVYQYLAQRFGERTRVTATICFLGSRLLGSAIRLSLAAIGFSEILGWAFTPTLILFTVLAVIYTAWGGIKAVVWTDLVQAGVFIGGGLAMVLWLESVLGWAQILPVATEAGRLELLRLAPEAGSGLAAWFNDPGLLWLAFLNGFVVIIAALGTDQDMTQRLLTCKDAKAAGRSVIFSGLIGVPVAGLFLMVGVGLFAFYQLAPGWTPPLTDAGALDGSRLFAYTIGDVLPVGLKGLLLCGIIAAAMSSLDSAMASLSSSAVIDLIRPFRQLTDATVLRLARWGVGVFGLLLMAIAWLLRDTDNFLWLALGIAQIPASTLLGIFLLGLLTKRGTDVWNRRVMLANLILTATLFALIREGVIGLAWPWIVVIGTTFTFGVGAVKSRH